MQLPEFQAKLKQASQPSARRFHALMRHRIKTILMVSSRYEAFSLEWDGSLAEDIYGAYSLLHLQNVPQLTTVTSAREALAALRRERYDLVLVSSNLTDMTIPEFGRVVKAEHPGLPLVMLIFALGGGPGAQPAAGQSVEYVFSWQGSAKVLLSIIKLAEDALNIDADLASVRLGVILVIEDSVKQYSLFLPHLYAILMKQAFARVPYGVDETERQLRTRTRPKVVLARTFAEAGRLAARYRPFLHGVISDLRITAEERKGRQVGRDFLRGLREAVPGLPILLMSADEAAPAVARALGLEFVDKNSPRCVRGLEEFCVSGLGFGDFVFRDRQGREIRRARSLREFEDALRAVPDESIEFHSARNQFSHWLLAQGEFGLAELIRPLQMADFKAPAEMRELLSEAVAATRREKHRGIVADFRPDDFEPEYLFLMTGRGSLGGKARGLAFMAQVLARQFPGNRLGGFEVQFPRTLVVTTDAFDAFMAANDLEVFAVECRDDSQLRERFLRARLPEELARKLRAYIERVRTPLAVRSSSHLEDSSSQPFAGLYETCMLPNAAAGADLRFEQLCRAVKLVYASAFTRAIKDYFQTLKLNMEEEKMAVIVQELVGRRYGRLFYPAISGVAQSFNYYPFARMAPEDGVAALALGFGKLVVEGGDALRFCPRCPGILPQASTPPDLLRVTQKQFYALDLERTELDWTFGKGSNLGLFELDQAERDLTLHAVASVISARDDRLVDDLAEEGVRVVTFAPVLKRQLFPLAGVLDELLKLGRENMGTEVELEFAANADFRPESRPEFYLLQIRPMASSRERGGLNLETIAPEQTLCACRTVMGNGVVENISDLIYCHPARFDFSQSRAMAETIGRLNQALLNQQRRYILIGPGRWGTRMPALGVPVSWQQVAGAAVIVETAAPGRPVDPSQGAHFFHNLALSGIGYFSLPAADAENFVRWDALERLPALNGDGLVRHLRLPHPATVYMDALNRRGLIATVAEP